MEGCIPESCGTRHSHKAVIISQKVLSRLLSPGKCIDSKLKHTHSLCKRHIYLSLNFSLKVRPQVCHTYRGYRSALRKKRPQGDIFSFSLILATACQYQPKKKSICTHPKFLYVIQGTHLESLEASRVNNCSYTGMCIFSYFKSCCLRVWLLISMKPGANGD